MAKGSSSDGVRDLSLIRKSGSTARVLNLALAYERHGKSEEFRAQPFFRSERLNRALIIKHALRAHERSLFDFAPTYTTKIVFPYSSAELELGGAAVLMGERQFEQLFKAAVGEDVGADDREADFETLCVLHESASFDPFLLREQLRRAGVAPAPCFFEISEADIAAMIAFVATEILPLASLAFGAGGRRAETLSRRLAEKLMTDENAQLLTPLRETLRLSAVEYREGVYAWKGFLYYKWRLSQLSARQVAFSESFKRCPIGSSGAAARKEIDQLRYAVLNQIERVMVRAGDATLNYSDAFAALARGEAASFRQFLLDAPTRFVSLGEAVGAVEHAHSIWGFRFPGMRGARLEAEDALELLGEFDRMLAGVELIRKPGGHELML